LKCSITDKASNPRNQNWHVQPWQETRTSQLEEESAQVKALPCFHEEHDEKHRRMSADGLTEYQIGTYYSVDA